jgi:MoaA/NifB/PqqE/SkfB family radical SAM enzyme
MWRILLKIPIYKFYYKYNFPRLYPFNLTISVTNRCNCRCLTCNIWKENLQELKLEEYEKIFKSIKSPPYWIILSGGEPFLRDDIVEICRLIKKYIKPKFLNIPTNATLENTYEKILEILKIFSDTEVIVNVSIDGGELLHNKIRNFQNCFQKVNKNFEMLKKIKNKNFTLGIGTVISKFNVNNEKEIIQILKKLNPSSFSFEIAEERKELNTKNLLISPDFQEYKNFLKEVYNFLGEKKSPNLTSKINKSLRKVYYKLSEEILERKTQVIPCYAGFASAHIFVNGEVWECCVEGTSFGNLKDVNYDFSKLWFSEKGNKIREKVKNKKCYCTLASAHYTNILFNQKTLIEVARNFFEEIF